MSSPELVVFGVGGALLAMVTALRGLWSPCGLSMISTITPLSERARGHRFWATALWFVLGATAGGATLGTVMAAGAWAVGQAGAGPQVRGSVLLLSALVTIASDARIFSWSLPGHPRQVNETWLARYRAWVYAGGFGWQIGTGFATYIMTAGVYLVAAVGVTSGRPLFALGLGTLFGFVRGGAVFVSVRADTPQRLRELHATIDRLATRSFGAAVAAQVLILGLCSLIVPFPMVLVGGGACVGIAVSVASRSKRQNAGPVG